MTIVAMAACEKEPATPSTPTQVPEKPLPLFTDVTSQVGLDFMHQSGQDGRYLLPEIQGGGAAVFDYDNDGDLDIYAVNAGNVPPDRWQDNTAPNRLFRQESDGTFTDVTSESGLGDLGYAMGCAVGDIDNDGDVDVYITNLGPDKLFRNNADGTFTDVTIDAGIDNDAWSASAAFLDVDRDGWLDLYVTNYVVFDPQATCRDGAGRPDYCGPKAFVNESDVLYRNLGDGRFVDVSESAGITRARGAGLGVLPIDVDDDGWIDIYVANDADPNNLWMNQGDAAGPRFTDDAVIRGVALNQHGIPEAGMGVTAADADLDGDADLFVTHLVGESNTFYRNIGEFGFDDATNAVGLGRPSLPYTGFGTVFFDVDNDGDEDLGVANGAVKRRDQPLLESGTFTADYAEPNQLFLNDGQGNFVDASAQAGALCAQPGMHRAFIPADVDADGDLDVLVSGIDQPLRLFRNNTPPAHAWVHLRARLGDQERIAVGARIVIHTPDRTFTRTAGTWGGYLTGSDVPVHVGLGMAERIDHIDVRWPDATWERFQRPRTRTTIDLVQGRGTPIDDGS